MNPDEIRETMHRVPFEPFSLRLADGREIFVTHPDFIAVGRRRIVVVHEDDSSSVISPLMIVSLEFNGEASGAGDSQESSSQ